MICWRRRSNGKYARMMRGKLVEQTYTSAPERQLMRAACAREDRAHTQQRSRVVATGRNTLKRQYDKVNAPEKPSLGGRLELGWVKKQCVAGASGARANA